MRVGLKTETGRVITASGVKPLAQAEWKRDNFWVYGVVEPHSGWHFEQEYDHLNSEQFQSFLDALDGTRPRHCLDSIDRQSASSPRLALVRELDSGLSTRSKPAVESARTLLAVGQSVLEGEHFANLTQLRQRLNQILAALLPEQVASLTSYDFILEALFYAAL
jgi:hypothetical protein